MLIDISIGYNSFMHPVSSNTIKIIAKVCVVDETNTAAPTMLKALSLCSLGIITFTILNILPNIPPHMNIGTNNPDGICAVVLIPVSNKRVINRITSS